MKVCVLCESGVDASGLLILLEALLSSAPELVPKAPRSGDFRSILGAIAPVMSDLHYHTDARGLVIVADTDRTPLHEGAHDEQPDPGTDCRLCRVRNEVARVNSSLSPAGHRPPDLAVAIGMATPCIEAWYRCGLDPDVSEATWRRHLQGEAAPYDPVRLKQAVYGGARGFETLRQIATEHARRLTADLARLEADFPTRFGSLAAEVRTWGELTV